MIDGKKGKTRKSQALLFVFFLLLLAGISAGALTVMLRAEMESRGRENYGHIAFYLSQSGIERAKIWARYNPASSYNSGWIVFGGGRYSYVVSPGAGPSRRVLTSRGQALDVNGRPAAERSARLEIDVGNPLLSGDETVDAWSWRET